MLILALTFIFEKYYLYNKLLYLGHLVAGAVAPMACVGGSVGEPTRKTRGQGGREDSRHRFAVQTG